MNARYPTNRRFATTLAVLLLAGATLPAQRPFQKFWEEKFKETPEPEMIEDGAEPLDLMEEDYLIDDQRGLMWSSTVFPGREIPDSDPVSALALSSYVEGAYNLETSSPSQALARFTQALEKDPENLYFKLRVADMSLRVNDVSTAERLYLEILEADPENIRAMIRMGELMNLRQRYADAATWFQKAVDLRPKNVEALQNLATLAYQVERDLEKTQGIARQILAVDDRNFYALLFNAEASARLGQVEDAALFYERLIRQRPGMLRPMEETARQLETAGRLEDAVYLFERALLMAPENQQLRASWEAAVNRLSGLPGLRASYERIIAESNDDLRLHELYADYLSRIRDWDRLIELRKEMLAIKPGDVKSLLDIARFYGIRGEFENAEPFFDMALAAGSNDPETLLAVAGAYMAEGKQEKAEPLFQKALVLNPADIESLRGLATIAAARGDYATAEKHLREAIDASPANPQLIKSLGILYRQQGDNAKAADQFQAVIAADRTDLEAWAALAGIYFEEENNPALDTLEKQAAEMMPDSPRFDFTYGVLAQRFGAHERSRRSLERVIRATPFDLTARKVLARVYAALDQPDAALRTLTTLDASITGSPRAEEILLERDEALAWLHIELRQYAEAEKLLATLIEKRPNELSLREPYLTALVEQDKEEDVRTEMNAVIRQFSVEHPIDTQLLRAQVFLQQNDAPRALGILRQLHQENPEHQEIKFRLANVASETRDIQLAEQLYRQLIESGGPAENPYYELSSNNLGYLLAQETDRLADAEALISQALKVNPTAAYILDSIGYVYFRKGDYDKARAYLERAARMESKDAEILTNLGQLYEKIGERELARASYEKALTLDPELPLPKERIEALAVTD